MAASLVSVKKQLDDLVECSICTEVFTDPRTLPCIHSYCFKCIADWCKDKQPGDKVACPLCRQEFSIPEGGVGDLPENFFIGNLLMINELSSTENKVKLCDACSVDGKDQHLDKTAEVFCFECQQNLCETCKKCHSKLRSSSTHTVVNISELSSDDQVFAKFSSTFCDKHKNEQIKIYCFDCETPICMMCYIKDHNAHKCSDVDEAAAEFRVSLTLDIQSVTTTIKGYDDKLNDIRCRRTSFLDQVQKIEREISERADQLKDAVESEKRKLLVDLFDIKANHEKEMDNGTHKITQSKSILESLRKYCQELLKKGTATDISRQVNSLRKRVEKLGEPDNIDPDRWSICDVSFSPAAPNVDRTNNFLGQIFTEGRTPVTPTLAHTLTGTGAVTAVDLLVDELFVTRSGVAQVSVYNLKSFQLLRQLTLDGLGTNPWGLATCATNKCLYVSDFSNNCIHRVDLSIDANTNGGTEWNVPSGPRGLSVNSSRNILVAFYEGKKVQEYTPSGSLVREISDINLLWQAVELSSGIMAVSRSGPSHHGLFTCSIIDGKVIHSYGSQPGSGVGQMNNPRCLAVDKRGYILVAEYSNHRIMVVNPTLTDVRQLPLPANTALQGAFALCLDQSRGRIYVGEWGGQNRVLVFDNVRNVGAMFLTS